MWEQLEHAYGPATDVPDLLAQVRDPVTAPAAIGELNANVYHDGDAVHSAAPALVPALLDLVEDPTVTVRAAIVETLGDLAHAARTADPSAVDPAWPAAWAAAVPRLVGLLADADVEVRRMVTFPLAHAVGHTVWPHLRDRYQDEPDHAARLGLVIAAGHATGHATGHDAGPSAEQDAREWLTGLRADRAVRLAASVALHRLDVHRLDVAADVDPDDLTDLEAWADTWCVGRPTPSAVVWWLNRELRADRAARRRLVTGLLDHPHPEVRTGALWSSADLLDDDLLPLVADRLADDEPENRRVAARLLASARAPFADDLALAARDAYLPAADAALSALALLGDVRAVEPLRRRLSGPRLGLPVRRDDRPWSPTPLEDVLTAMRDHAAALLPAVEARLGATTDPVESAAFQRVLQSWQHDS